MTSQSVELSASRARDRAERIRTALNVSWQLVKDAYVDRDWLALGYASWDDYCTGEFGEFRIKLPREERQEVVSSMREIGMSYRAIGAAVGIDPMTARADVRGVENSTPESEPAPVTGTDGKTYTPKPRPEPEEEQTPPEWEEVGNIPQSRLSNLTPAPGFNPGGLDEINTTTEPPEPTQANTPDKQGDNLNNILDQLNMALETLETLNLETATTANKKEALKKIEQANRTLNNIKKRLR